MNYRKTHKWQVFRTIAGEQIRYFMIFTVLIALAQGVLALLFDRTQMIYRYEVVLVPLLAFLLALPGFIYVFFEASARWGVILLQALQFLLAGGMYAAYMRARGMSDIREIGTNAIGFLLLYAAITVYNEWRERKTANEINARIDAFHGGENATHLHKD